MTGVVLQFKKPDGKSPHHRATDVPAHVEKTEQEIFQEVYDIVLDDWRRFAVKNRLNEFIASRLPASSKTSDEMDYANDLNVLANIEQKLAMRVVMFYPGCTESNPNGWLVSFHYGSHIYSTSSNMLSEANARALNILLYLSFKRSLKDPANQ